MTGSDVASALARIDQALEAIEAAIDATPATVPQADDSAEAAELRAANERLRGLMRSAVADLDRLLAGAD